MSVLRFELVDEEATQALGGVIARALPSAPAASRFHVDLLGDLGAGKTTLVRAVLRGLGFEGRVKSPTYPLLELYQVAGDQFCHFDLYRLETPEAFSEAGFDEYFSMPGLCFVEWPDRAAGHLPPPDWVVSLSDSAHGGRILEVDARTEQGQTCLERLA